MNPTTCKPEIQTHMERPYGRVDYLVTCPCGFTSGPHRAYDSATWVANGHAVQMGA